MDTSDHRDIQNIGKLDLRNGLLGLHHAGLLAVTLVRESPSIVYVPLAQNMLGLGRDLLFIGLGLAAGARVVAHVHGGGLGTFLERAPWWFRASAQALLRRCAALIATSRWQRDRLEAAIPDAHIAIVPHGTKIQRTPPRASGEGRLRALYVSSYLDESKGLYTVLRTAAKAQSSGITDSWEIVGEWASDGARRRAEEMADGVPSIRFRGALDREQIRQAYASADVFVFPTRAPEAFSLVRIEAMAAGLPVITTEAGGAREIVRDGIDGFIVGYDSSDEILVRLRELRSQPERFVEMGDRARERQRALFSEESFERTLAAVWRAVATGRG